MHHLSIHPSIYHNYSAYYSSVLFFYVFTGQSCPPQYGGDFASPCAHGLCSEQSGWLGQSRCAYSIAMPQCFPALSPAAWKPDRPISATVGVMVSGPMYLSSTPGRPSAPMHTSIRDDTMMAPWICRSEHSVNLPTVFWDISANRHTRHTYLSYPGVPDVLCVKELCAVEHRNH